MKLWRVILATAVIFCSGLAIGALVAKRTLKKVAVEHPAQRSSTNAPLSVWHVQQREFIRRMDKELDLNPEQRERITLVLKESQERTKLIREKIAPEMREELKNVRDQIRAELGPEQQEKFEAAMKIKARKTEEQTEETRRKKDGSRRQPTNAPATNSAPAEN